MRIAVLHNKPLETATADDEDVLLQVAAVTQALDHIGHTYVTLPCTLNLEFVQAELAEIRPDLVFNLVEALGGTDRLSVLVPYLLEAAQIPYTGCPLASMLLANGKITAKEWMVAADLPTPEWVTRRNPNPPADNHSTHSCPLQPAIAGTQWIIKSEWEHASFQIGDDAIRTFQSEDEIQQVLEERARLHGGSFFAERFIDGREFNVSAIGRGDGGDPLVLPIAEISFTELPPHQPRIVGYAAKWNENSYEFHHTPRIFPSDDADPWLLKQIRELVCRVWQHFRLRGFARVDFRVDSDGKLHILEVNTNPCLSPDAGFQAALAEAKIPFSQAIEWILADALNPLSLSGAFRT
jgi:D-alanine-D-alanine ligase